MVIGGFKKGPFFRKLSFSEFSFFRILPFAEIFFLSYPFAIFLLVDAKILTLLGNWRRTDEKFLHRDSQLILYTHFGSIAAPELTVQWEKVRYSSPPRI